jgi:hypothetical protein
VLGDKFTSEKDAAREMMRKGITTFFKNNKSYEVSMKIKDGSDNAIFYGQKEDDFIKSLIMFVDDPSNCVIIRLLGKFTTEDIRKITEKCSPTVENVQVSFVFLFRGRNYNLNIITR